MRSVPFLINCPMILYYKFKQFNVGMVRFQTTFEAKTV
ncbi:hypothetical protein N875_02200 [Neisseria meningitidis LNP21362]|uniref:Uncharacterized protein n=1 Tax=Neisseria meningitidis serogroup B TaxID=491 RepID=A0A0H5QUM5_NEIMI|nr:hypothetical protein N875_02200 [Neisseria meningitidis LNP21362]CRY99348.1 hypothetical protein [Neisseria meningitidis serogroup B]